MLMHAAFLIVRLCTPLKALQSVAGPVLPLSERPVQARVSADDLFAWHATAIAQADAVGSAFADADGGPSAEDLKVCPALCVCTTSCEWAHRISSLCSQAAGCRVFSTPSCSCLSSVSDHVLQIELNWLLDDTVDAAQASADGQWKPCTWRQLQSNMDLHHPEDTSNASSPSIALRADISTLTQLWKQRTQDRYAFCSFSNRHWRKAGM